jgi:hypothetical protein
MAAVEMFIDKFDRVVTIDEDHPLAVAQREKDAKAPRPPKASERSAPATRSEPEAPAAGEGEPEVPATKPNLSRKTVKQLTALCKKRGIEVPEGSTKKELVALLEGASE